MDWTWKELLVGLICILGIAYGFFSLDHSIKTEHQEKGNRCIQLYGEGSVYHIARYDSYCIDPNGDMKGLK